MKNMKYTASIIAIAFFAACSFSALAQDINQTVQTIVKNNASLNSQRTELRAGRNDAADANSLDNPEIGFSRVWGYRGVGNKWDFSVSQSFDWPGLYRTRSKATDAVLTAGEMALAASELDLAMQAKGLLLELVSVRKCLNIDSIMLKNIAEMQTAADKAFDSGYITILDKRKLQIQRYSMENEIADHLSRAAEITAELQGMCPNTRLTIDEIDAYPIEPLLSKEDYLEQVAALDPLLHSARLTCDSESLLAKAAAQSRLPSFSVGFQHVYELGDSFNGFSLGMSLPLFQNRKARSTALLRRETASATAEAELRQRQEEISGKYKSMEAWRRDIENYNRVFGDNAYLTLLKKALDGGEISIIEYLNETNYFHETTRVYIKAEYNYNTSLAWLNRYSLLSNI